MKKFDVSAFSLDEAKAKALDLGVTVVRNVTQSWRNAGSPITDRDLRAFAVDSLEKNHLTNAEGVGLIVALDNGTADSRKRPYEYVNNVTDGRKTIERVYEVRRKDTGALVASAKKKGKAEQLAKKAMVDVQADMECNIVYHVKEGKDLAFTLKYAPSVNAKMGHYVVFGNERSY